MFLLKKGFFLFLVQTRVSIGVTAQGGGRSGFIRSAPFSIQTRKKSKLDGSENRPVIPKKRKREGARLVYSARSRAALVGRFLSFDAQFSVDALCRGGKPQGE